MRRRLSFLFCVLLCPGLSPATALAQAEVSGYAVAGPAWFNGFFGPPGAGLFQLAAGGDVVGARGVGVAAEVGVLGRGTWAGMLSLNGVWQAPHARGARWTPFATGGYTRIGNGDHALDAWNAGAGLTWRPEGRVGIRLEARDQIRPDRRGTVHYWTLRGGVTFK